MKIQWNKVTWYSKIVALALFVALPFIGFYFGTQYGRTVGIVESEQWIMPLATATPSVSASEASSPEYYRNTAEWQGDSNSNGGFSLAYPIDFNANDLYSATPTTDWRMGAATTAGLKYFTLTIPKAFEPQTNFADATLTVGSSKSAAAVKECLVPDQNEVGQGSATSTITINGTPFTVFQSADAGAGNYYETTSYRAVNSGQCYAIEYTIHSSQIMNYPIAYNLKDFDENKLTDLLNRIVGTFTFTNQ